MRVPELVRIACERAGVGDVRESTHRLESLMLPFWETGMIDLFWHMPELAVAAGESPLVSPFARLCADAGSQIVPSLLGCASFLDTEADRLLLLALDGTKDRASLSGEFGLDAEELDSKLREFARMGLLLR